MISFEILFSEGLRGYEKTKKQYHIENLFNCLYLLWVNRYHNGLHFTLPQNKNYDHRGTHMSDVTWELK